MTTFIIVWALQWCQLSYYDLQGGPKCYGLPDKYINVSEVAQMDPYRHFYCKKWTGGTADGPDATGYANCYEKSGVGCKITLKNGDVVRTFQACTAFKKLVM